MGHKWVYDKNLEKWIKTNKLLEGQVPDILFIERCLQFLNNNGRMAIVLPDGNLNNSSLGYVREFIAQKARIIAVVSMPIGTFMHAGVNPKASVFFLQKLDKKDLEKLNKRDYLIFMAIAEKIGYDLTSKTPKIIYKSDKKGDFVRDEKGNLILDTDIPEIIAAFEDFKRKHKLKF